MCVIWSNVSTLLRIVKVHIQIVRHFYLCKVGGLVHKNCYNVLWLWGITHEVSLSSNIVIDVSSFSMLFLVNSLMLTTITFEPNRIG